MKMRKGSGWSAMRSWRWLGFAALGTMLSFGPAKAGAQDPGGSAALSGADHAKETLPGEPEFKPGIPGLKMVDVRDHKQLWRDIEDLQSRESGNRISIAEYRRQAIEKTSRFLGLEGVAADRFAAAAADEVTKIRESFLRTRRADAAISEEGDPFSSDLSSAVTRMGALLGHEPRHQLFLPDGKKWLLRLAFGPKEDKEAKEAREALAEPKAKNPKG